MKCSDCKFCLLQDFGYSNWTVEGTDCACLLDLNPALPADHFYGDSPALDYADKCPRFTAGEATIIDCDMEPGLPENYSNDPQIKELIAKRRL